MSERRPAIPAYFSVHDLSDRMFLYGFARILPIGLWIGGLIGLVIASQIAAIPALIGVPIFLVCTAGAFWLDRSKLIDPVQFINFGDFIMVKRMMSKQSLPPDRIQEIDLSTPKSDGYDDYDRDVRKADLTIRFQRAWTARMLVAHEDAISIAVWAKANGVKMVEPEPTRFH